MALVQFDMTRPRRVETQSLPIRDRLGQRARQPWRRRLALYGIAVVAGGLLLIWQHGQSSAIVEASEQGEETMATEQRLITAAVMGNASAHALADHGFDALEADDLSTASLYLRSAATKDPKYRDAAVYAGYAELARADQAWKSDPTEAEKRTKTAATLLEQAKLIDPIHAYTYELLAIAYGNLGKSDLAADASAKAETFAVTNIAAD